ncbi:MAG TPA: nuclear transport factor 2 family protein [Acidobacteriaceae bacterium]|nr:nuclear transport factor 2 family protein [Acidobacteriaceae bacterium]
MKTLLRAVVWICMVFLMLGAAWGQRDSGASADATAVDVSGRWLGSFDIMRQDGTVEPDNAVFELKQSGRTLAGSAGQSESKMTPLKEGEVTNETVRFTVVVHQNMPVHFALKVEGDRLRGEATGLPGLEPGSTVTVNVARWPEGTPAPEIVHAQDVLFRTVAGLDTKLFDAYNHCDLETMGAMVEDGLEFYHDKTGLMVGKQPFLEAIKNNICGKVERTLVPGSLEVYPLKDYGAVEIGVHRFSHPGHPDDGMGEAKFVTLWENKNGTWKMSRAISFDHEPVKQ